MPGIVDLVRVPSEPAIASNFASTKICGCALAGDDAAAAIRATVENVLSDRPDAILEIMHFDVSRTRLI